MPRGGVVCRGIRRTFTSAPWVRSTDRGNVSATAASATALYEQMEVVPGFTFAFHLSETMNTFYCHQLDFVALIH